MRKIRFSLLKHYTVGEKRIRFFVKAYVVAVWYPTSAYHEHIEDIEMMICAIALDPYQFGDNHWRVG